MKRSFYLTGLIQIIVGLAEALLLLRILLRLFNASPTASFVHWVYTTSNGLLTPFRGAFPTATFSRGYVIDFTALFALVVYAIIGLLLAYLVNLLERSLMTPAGTATTTTKRPRL